MLYEVITNRFCNLYNIPIIFMEDTTGFLPGREQEARGIVQAGRSMLDSIVDVRTSYNFV